MKKKAIAILLATTLVMTSVVSLTGCGDKKKTDEPTPSKTEETAKKFTGTRILKDTNGKVKTINPHTWTTSAEGNMMGLITENFVNLVLNDTKDGFKMIPVLAKEMPKINADKTVYTYTLRDNLKFSDGTPIDADAFMYSFKMMLDPKLKNYRANNCFSSIYIKNAENYFNGKCKWEDVGIKSPDKKTLEFTLEIATPELSTQVALGGLGSCLVHPGLYEKGLNKDRTETNYGTTMETFASYGAYTLKEWIFDQSFKVQKNKDLVLADIYTPDIVESRVMEEPATILQLFENNEVDIAAIDQASFQKYSEDPRMVLLNTGSVLQMNINTETKTLPILKDMNFRKALFYATNREKLAKDIAKTDLPAPFILSPYFSVDIDGKAIPYRDTDAAKAVLPKNNGFDEKQAKELFEKAYATNGSKKVTVTLIYNEAASATKAISESMKNDMEKLFGADKFELKLQAVPRQVRTENVKKGDYDLAMVSWLGGDAFNAADKLAVYLSEWGDKNDTFKNKEFDKLYDRCMKGDLLLKSKEKVEAIAQMEKMILDEIPFVPITEGRDMVVYSDKLKLQAKKWITYLNYAPYEAEFTR